MKRVAFLPAAQADIHDIWYYTARQWSIHQADHYIDDLLDTCQKLASGDRQGRKAELRGADLKYPIGSHMIYLRDLGDQIEIVRILHGSMDASRHLN
jgi:toxin ParE1/3/4